MRRGLRLRLALTHAAVAVLAIVVVALIVNVGGGRRFDDYLADVQRERNAAVVDTLVQTYRPPDGWDAAAIFALSQVAALNNVDLAVYSPEGQLQFTVQGRGRGRGMMGGQGMMGGGMMGSASPAAGQGEYAAGQFAVQSYPVEVDGDHVATVEIYSPSNLRIAADSAYREDATRNLVLAALVAGGLALLISLLVSRRITAPLEELTDAAADVANGDLDVRVAPRGVDEVGALATAFNSMADRLARDEQWRRDMTADLSHELRTPLATIQARVEALEDGVLPATPENLRVIGDEVERLGGLLGALRSLNELEADDLGLAHDALDLADVARDAAARAEAAYRLKGVTLESELIPVTVTADRERVLQVAAGLLDNALKFTPAGGRVVMTVAPGEDHRDAPGRGWGVLEVTDSGPGIDPVDLPFVFDRFYRSQSARGMQGVGLGLAIARGLVEAQGGTIAAGDGPEGGARFSVCMPAAV